MHQYLRAIGFSEQMKKADELALCRYVEAGYEEKCICDRGDDTVFGELQRSVGRQIGIGVRGEYTENGRFIRDYYFPYYKSGMSALYDYVDVQQHAEKESFSGIFESVSAGLNLVFYLQNAAEYMKYVHAAVRAHEMLAVTLSALSVDGRILLPVASGCPTPAPVWAHEPETAENPRFSEKEAMENEALEEMDMYHLLTRRIKKEDLYSVVESCFMPFGVECDQYAVLGEITNIEKAQNVLTGDSLYFLAVTSNGIQFEVCINEKDLLGEPKVGRRFKGVVWLQGYLARE